MTTNTNKHESAGSLAETYKKLPHDLQQLLPEANMIYLNRTNQAHCGPGEGGSKFEDVRVQNIFDVVALRPDLPERVSERIDDREALKAAGAPDEALRPATKGPDAPTGPEVLYYMVEGVKGRLGIIKVGELPPDQLVLVTREKGKSDPNVRGYTPTSFTVIRGTIEDMPKTDFATIIVGRDGGETGTNEVWTVHPGAPIRPAVSKEFDWTGDLRSPEELKEGEKPAARVMTLAKLMEEAGLKPEDYVKIAPGDLDEVIKGYEVLG